MEKFCPITDRFVDEHVARLNSALVILFFAGAYFLESPVLVAFIFIDFIIRGFWEPSYSPIANFSKWIIRSSKIKPRTINAGPKIFAAQVGTLLSGVTLLCILTGLGSTGCYVAGVLVFFAFLESAFSFCVACKLYPYFRKLIS